MAYHRVEPYVWDDGEYIHIWSSIDDQPSFKFGVRVDTRIFDEIVVKRLSDMIEEGRVPPAILWAVRKMGGKYINEMLIAARKPPKEGR